MARHRLASTVGSAFVGMWLGTLTIATVTAAVAFPTMKGLGPTLPGLAVPVDEHWLIAAGAVARKVFDISAGVEAACAVVVVIAAIVIERQSGGRLSTWARRVGVVVAVAALAWTISVQMKMDSLIDTYWVNAKSGKIEVANVARDAFRALHPTATTAQGACGLALLLAGVGFITSARRHEGEQGHGA